MRGKEIARKHQIEQQVEGLVVVVLLAERLHPHPLFSLPIPVLPVADCPKGRLRAGAAALALCTSLAPGKGERRAGRAARSGICASASEARAVDRGATRGRTASTT